MHLMCWDVDIVSRIDSHLLDANYWSQLGAYICFDPLFKSYLNFNQGLCERFPASLTLPITPENMPYYCKPQLTLMPSTIGNTPSDDNSNSNEAHNCHCQSVMSVIIDYNCGDLSYLSNIPVHYGNFDTVTPTTSHALTNNKIPSYAQQVLHFNWAVYSFGGGHFMSTVSSCNLPFNVKLASNHYESRCTFF
jgi:hypothetical protein